MALRLPGQRVIVEVMIGPYVFIRNYNVRFESRLLDLKTELANLTAGSSNLVIIQTGPI